MVRMSIELMAIALGGIMLVWFYGLRLELREWSAELRGRYADPSK